MELSILIKHFYFGLLPSYQNALDIMVGEPFSTFDTEQAYKILNGLSYFSLVDEAGVLTRLDKIERSLNNLDLGNHAKEQPLVELKNDWEPFIEIIIGSEKFHAYCDLGSPMSIMPKIVYNLLKLDGMVDYPVFHFHANGTIMKSLGI